MSKSSLTPQERRAVARAGGPPPPLPPRPAGPESLGEAPPVPKSLASLGDGSKSAAGDFEVSRTDFEQLGTGRTARHLLPAKPSETQGPIPVPLD
jgi:hypothetical protein